LCHELSAVLFKSLGMLQLLSSPLCNDPSNRYIS
jgi:hypothetical protein